MKSDSPDQVFTSLFCRRVLFVSLARLLLLKKIRFHAHERVSAIIFKLTTKMRQFILVKQHHKSARRDVSEMFFLSHSFFHTFL